MIFRQLFDFKTWTYTYLIASQKGGEALIIDPVLDRVERYMQLFEELDIKLVKALDTHVHADHITGLGALRDRTQCVTVMSDKSKVDVVSMRVADGDMIDIEGISIKTLLRQAIQTIRFASCGKTNCSAATPCLSAAPGAQTSSMATQATSMTRSSTSC